MSEAPSLPLTLDQPPPNLNPTVPSAPPKGKNPSRSVSPKKKSTKGTTKTIKKASIAPAKEPALSEEPVPAQQPASGADEISKLETVTLTDPPSLKPSAPPVATKVRSSRSISPAKASKSSTGNPVPVKVARKATALAAKDTMSGTEADPETKTPPLVDDLKSQLRKAEVASEQYRKQLLTLQSRLDDALGGQAKLEKTTDAHAEIIESLQNDHREVAEHKKQLESLYDNNNTKAISLRERNSKTAKEEELNEVILRLQDALAQREPRRRSMDGHMRLSRTTSYRGRSPPYYRNASPSASSDPLESSQSLARLLLQKEKTIEGLKMELAESHMRLVEIGNADSRRIRELERDLLATQMTNAKLMEDGEYYQILLQERTLNGELAHRGIHSSADLASSERLIGPQGPSQNDGRSGDMDQFETAVGIERENVRKLEMEVASLHDQNNALTLYINRIITRLLQHESFEGLFENGSLTGDNPLNAMQNLKKNSNNHSQQSLKQEESRKENAPPPTIRRAGSIFGGRLGQHTETTTGDTAPDPTLPAVSNAEIVLKPPADAILTERSLAHPNEDPNTAARIPLRRAESRRRTYRVPSSEWTSSNNPYRGPPSSGSHHSSGQVSPGIGQRQSSYFGIGTAPAAISKDAGDYYRQASRATSDSGYSETMTAFGGSQAASGVDARSGSPSRSISASSHTTEGRASVSTFGTGAGTGQGTGPGTILAAGPGTPNKIRTLRLVQEKVDAEEAAAADRRKSNRNSWMGWFGKGEMPPPPPPHRTQAQWPGAPRGGSPVKRRAGSGVW